MKKAVFRDELDPIGRKITPDLQRAALFTYALFFKDIRRVLSLN
tara:strand:- start:8 stop:139 length:132 start_codon:yes stop_codon:yes gene_type:complete